MDKNQLQYFSMDTLRQMHAELHVQRAEHVRDNHGVVDIDAMMTSIKAVLADKEAEPT